MSYVSQAKRREVNLHEESPLRSPSGISKFVLVILLVVTAGICACRRDSEPETVSATGDLAPASELAPPGFSRQFYVAPGGNDGNNGSATAPWATLQHAADAVTPGTVVHVAPGTYDGVSTRRSGATTARIRFISDIRWEARVRTTRREQVWFNSADYVDIMGFDISGDGRLGILNMGSSVHIIGNHVHNIPAPCTSDGGAGIDNANYDARDDDTIGNVVHDIGNLLQMCRHVHGIYHSNLRGHILNNISYRNQGWGIHLWHAANAVVIANNLVFSNGEGGIIVGAGDAPGGVTAAGIVVVNNMILDHHGIGVYEYGHTGANNFYANNLIWNNSRAVVLQNDLRAVNTIRSDPRLVNYQPDGRGDYHLLPESPAIKAGTPAVSPLSDFDGRARPSGVAPDIGAFQLGTKRAPWPWM